MNLTGVVLLSEEMDTAGFSARETQIFYEIACEWLVLSRHRISVVLIYLSHYRYMDSPVANKQI